MHGVRDFTLVQNEYVQRVLKSEGALFRAADHPPLSGSFLSPAISEWRPGDSVTLEGFYHHQLAGAVNDFVVVRAVELLQKRHGIDEKLLYRVDLLSAYTLKAATLDDRYSNLMVKSLGGEAKDMYRGAMEAFPKGPWRPDTWDADWRDMQSHRPYYSINTKCLPPIAGDTVAPWFKDRIKGQLVSLYIHQIIEQSRDHYLDLLEGRYGRRFGDRKAISAAPGGFLYDIGGETAFAPIVAEVLNQVKIGDRFEDVTLRTAEEIVRRPTEGNIVSSMYGEVLPPLRQAK